MLGKRKNTIAAYITEFRFTRDEYAKLDVIANARNTSPGSVTPFHIARSRPVAEGCLEFDRSFLSSACR